MFLVIFKLFKNFGKNVTKFEHSDLKMSFSVPILQTNVEFFDPSRPYFEKSYIEVIWIEGLSKILLLSSKLGADIKISQITL